MEENVKIDAVEGKCPSCGGILKFDNKSKCLVCEDCGSKEVIAFDASIIKHDIIEGVSDNVLYQKWVSNNKVFRCTGCGANMVLGSYEMSHTCPYCGNNAVCDSKTLPGLVPDGIVLFAFEKPQALTLFKEDIKKRWFLPNKFKKNLPESTIAGMYYPSFAFDANTFSTYNGVLIKEKSREVSHHVRNAEGDIVTRTETEYYDEPFTISGQHSQNFANMLVESSSKINQVDIMDILPFNLQEAVKFNPKYALAHPMEYYNNTLANCHNNANSGMKRDIQSNILSKYEYSRVQTFNMTTTFSKEKYSYLVLPMYRIEYEYNNKKYKNYMNGQTGKVGGKIPRSGLKIGLFIGIIAAIVIAIIILANI